MRRNKTLNSLSKEEQKELFNKECEKYEQGLRNNDVISHTIAFIFIIILMIILVYIR